jgi:enoyl-CoA hydratase
MILTGLVNADCVQSNPLWDNRVTDISHSRVVRADEAKTLNLVNYLAGPNQSSFDKALEVAQLLASHPQTCMRSDRLSMLQGLDQLSFQSAMQQEFALGIETLRNVDFGGAVDAFVRKKETTKL